jgi:hypothetical protein
MYCLSDQQMEYIQKDIINHGIAIESLQHNLLDHICIIIEQNLEENGDFHQFYESTIPTFYKNELREIEDEAIFLLSCKGIYAQLNRNQFFLLLFTILVGPFIAYLIVWFANSNLSNIFNIPFEIWASTLVFSLFPLLVWLVLFLTPDSLDPLIPRKSKILLGIRPLIKIIPPSDQLC